MSMQIRQESTQDYLEVERLIQQVFASEESSDKQEHLLVARLRCGESFIRELSLVAELDNKIIGHILFTRAKIIGDKSVVDTLVLAPLVVCSDFQKHGIGTKLINFGLKKAIDLGFSSVMVLGDPNYYSKFGFKSACEYGIKAPFEVEDKYFMAVELKSQALKDANGVLQYAKEFGI
ncbi:MAG: N-acetyltransferase [Neisseriaceae bacterium]|nr:MAG: N-acetyltransferase [Neisseriaceae bacterium]